MPHDPNYVPSQFDHRDYRQLYSMAKDMYLRRVLHEANYRDKKIQYKLTGLERKVLTCPFEQVLLYVNVDTTLQQDILKWRLTIAK